MNEHAKSFLAELRQTENVATNFGNRRKARSAAYKRLSARMLAVGYKPEDVSMTARDCWTIYDLERKAAGYP